MALVGVPLGCGGTDEKSADAFKPGIEWLEDMRERVSENIAEPDRRAKIMVMVDQLAEDLVTLDQAVQKLYTDLDALNKDYDATPEDFKAAIAKFEADREIARVRIMDTRFNIRSMSTQEEWEDLTDVRKRKGLYKQTIRLPQN